MDTLNKDDFKYQQAKKRVVEVKGFYIHLLIYLLVNIGLIITRHAIEGEKFGSVDNYYTAFFWGVGLLAHALSVFLPNFILGKDWEARKIGQLMDKNK